MWVPPQSPPLHVEFIDVEDNENEEEEGWGEEAGVGAEGLKGGMEAVVIIIQDGLLLLLLLPLPVLPVGRTAMLPAFQSFRFALLGSVAYMGVTS
jgi:hypothetical protein